jgi:ankyrin repeat protein
MTPLHRAASTGNAAVVALLLAHGARADALDTAGNSAMQAARAGGHDAVVTLLTSHAAVLRDEG